MMGMEGITAVVMILVVVTIYDLVVVESCLICSFLFICLYVL